MINKKGAFVLKNYEATTTKLRSREDADRHPVESIIGLKGGFGLTPGKLLTLKGALQLLSNCSK